MFLPRRLSFYHTCLTKTRFHNSPNSLLPVTPTTSPQPIYRSDRTILLSYNKHLYFTTLKGDDMMKFEEQIEKLEKEVFGKSYITKKKAESVKIKSHRTKDLEFDVQNTKYIQEIETKNHKHDFNKSSPSSYDSNKNISNKNMQKNVSETNNGYSISHNNDENISITSKINQKDISYNRKNEIRTVDFPSKLSRTELNGTKKSLEEAFKNNEDNITIERDLKYDEFSNSENLQETMVINCHVEKQEGMKHELSTPEILQKKLQNLKDQFWKNENRKNDPSAQDILQKKLQNLKEQFWKSKDKDKQEKQSIKIKELQNELLRSYAVQENIRQSLKADAKNTSSIAITNFSRNIIQTSDYLTQTIESIPGKNHTNDIISTIYEGLQMMDMSLMKAFQKAGLTKLGEVGEPFDYKKHIVLDNCTQNNQVNGSISFVSKIGFLLEGEVLRKAEVTVIKKKKEN